MSLGQRIRDGVKAHYQGKLNKQLEKPIERQEVLNAFANVVHGLAEATGIDPSQMDTVEGHITLGSVSAICKHLRLYREGQINELPSGLQPEYDRLMGELKAKAPDSYTLLPEDLSERADIAYAAHIVGEGEIFDTFGRPEEIHLISAYCEAAGLASRSLEGSDTTAIADEMRKQIAAFEESK